MKKRYIRDIVEDIEQEKCRAENIKQELQNKTPPDNDIIQMQQSYINGLQFTLIRLYDLDD